MVTNTESRGKSAVPTSFFQCRVSPYIKRITKKYPINYDSALIFPTREMASTYMPMFIKKLYEDGFLEEKQDYETKIIQLATYIPEMQESGGVQHE